MSLEPLIYDIGVPGRRGVNLPDCDVPGTPLPADLLRADLRLPEVSELQVVRHFVNLSHLNHAIDTGFYPLGSCTMKYNPKINEDVERHAGFALLHPHTEMGAQGALAVIYTVRTGWPRSADRRRQPRSRSRRRASSPES
jgi:glycine dehydrogenase subunit 2